MAFSAGTRLEDLAKARVMQTADQHYCRLCIRDLGGESEIESLDLDARADMYVSLPRESTDFRVKSARVVFAVPQLAVHYVAAHQYQPPPEFCAAVMTTAPVARNNKSARRRCDRSSQRRHPPAEKTRCEWPASDIWLIGHQSREGT